MKAIFRQLVVAALVLSACASESDGDTPKVEIMDTKVSVVAPDPKPEIDPALAEKFRASVINSLVTASVINNGDTPVKGSLDLARGTVDFSGATPAVNVVIDVTSFNSDILLRDDRVRQFFFKTVEPGRDVMTLTLKTIPPDIIARLRAERAVKNIPVTADLTFAGMTKAVTANVVLEFTDGWHFTVKSASPVTVKISEWGLGENLKSLIEICRNQSVSDEVRVEFIFDFKPVKS